MRSRRKLLLLAVAFVVSSMPSAASGPASVAFAEATLLASGLEGGSGSTVGPGGAIYVTEPLAGRVSRVDPKTGKVSIYASGLPKRVVDVGGAMDVAFIGRTAYVLVTLVGPDVGGDSVVGIYRIDGPNRVSVVADIGEFALDNPPPPGTFFVPTGVQYAMQPYFGGFLVTDGHHNRVLHVTLGGRVKEVMTFGNIVPTGLALLGPIALMAQAGPVPHLAEDGRIVAFLPGLDADVEIASGAPLLVDVEFGRGRLYALSQGDFPEGNPEGSPAAPNTGSLVRVNLNGTFSVITEGLDQPTSLEFIGDTAYVVTLGGEVWKIEL